MTTKHVLIVDDEADIRELLVLTLMRMGIEAEAARDCKEAYARLKERPFDLCLTDMRLPDGDGLGVLAHIAENYGNTPVAVITAYGSTDNAVSALKAGAFDYISKPIQLKQLREVITSALNLPKAVSDRGDRSRRNTASERRSTTGAMASDTALPASGSGIPAPGSGPRLLGESAPIQRARDMIAKLARSQAPVYIAGESGTGKEVAARLIHSGSARRDAAFVAVNCGAIPENLMESEFFGYRKGAFTGADADKDGFLHAADGGTLFLDEVGDLPLAMQVKLLRVIQEKKVRKVGDTAELPVDFRIISATHKNLAEKVAAGEFRQDLFYRLNVIELKMPSLREIPEDIPLLVKLVLERIAQQSGVALPELGEDAMRALKGYDYPGNVRELENILERSMALCDGKLIRESDLYLTEESSTPGSAASVQAGERTLPLHEYLDQIEREQILKALELTRFNKTAAAKVLGITFRSLRYRLDRLGIE
ncbi:MAG: sigma-54-dependent Fis family transcriptional regulator [Betaproteobacteria bacterium]|nr:sigma-54-dependent Fis family transcriptional regulator [Betaproteobacteria bacterium]